MYPANLPITRKGFSLSKKVFTDVIALRYDLSLDGLPVYVLVEHLSILTSLWFAKKEEFICARHEKLRDLTGQMLNEVS